MSRRIELAKNVKCFRENMGLTQSELADKMAVDVQDVFDIENGKTNASIDFIIDFSQLADVCVDVLIGNIESIDVTF